MQNGCVSNVEKGSKNVVYLNELQSFNGKAIQIGCLVKMVVILLTIAISRVSKKMHSVRDNFRSPISRGRVALT